tara:strand:+ start:6082 stop:6801 length:720 start_codon:yes stop_codon:yes gene_type:complete
MATVQTNIRLDKDLRSWYDAKGAEEDRDAAYFMKKALVEFRDKFDKRPKPASLPAVKQKSKANDDVNRIFEYWCQVMKKDKKTKLTPKRKGKIEARLKEGYGIDDIAKAIEGCAASEYHMGNNDTSTIYNDIELICRSGEKLESFQQHLTKPIFDNRHQGGNNGRKKSLAERTIDNAAELQAFVESGQFDQSSMGENDPAISQQMDFSRGRAIDHKPQRHESDEPEFRFMVQQDGVINP